MPNDDTIKLLNECNSGIKMGVQGINEVMDNAENKQLIDILNKYLKEHERLGNKTHEYLNKFEEPIISYQIVGHTPVETITALSSENYTIYFIDTHSTYKDGSEYGDKSYLFWNENQFEYLKWSEIDENKK